MRCDSFGSRRPGTMLTMPVAPSSRCTHWLKAIIPLPIRRRLATLRRQRATPPNGSAWEKTVAEGWEEVGRAFEGAGGERLGDVWNDPDAIGIDVPADRIVTTLDQRVFGPFLGSCHTLLEIGAGGGRFTEVLLPRCERLIATDTSPAMLRMLRGRFGESERIDYRLLDGRGLAFLGDETIDAAFSYDVFVHIQHWDIYNYLREVRRVLMPGGKAIIQHANTFSELGWQRFVEDVPASLNRHKLLNTFTVMTPDLMVGFVERAGLRVVDIVTTVVRRDAITLIVKDESNGGPNSVLA
jgi:SAM-dependent methyltransferase